MLSVKTDNGAVMDQQVKFSCVGEWISTGCVCVCVCIYVYIYIYIVDRMYTQF